MAVPALYIHDDIRVKLSSDVLQQAAVNLHPQDCQACGNPLGEQTPSVSVDDFGPFITALLNHEDCRPSGWYTDGVMPGGRHMSWTSRCFTLHMDTGGTPDPRAMFIVCPHLEAVTLDQEGGGWSVNTGRHWRKRGFRPMGPELVVDRWVSEEKPPAARMEGSTVHIHAGMEGRWSAPADAETVQVCRAQGGFLLGISTSVNPVATAGPQEVLQRSVAGEIFFGWVSLP